MIPSRPRGHQVMKLNTKGMHGACEVCLIPCLIPSRSAAIAAHFANPWLRLPATRPSPCFPAIPPRLAPHFANVLLSCCCVLQVASPCRRQAMPFFSSYHNVHFHEERCFCCRPVRRCLRCCSRHVVAVTRLCRCYHCRPRLTRVGTVLPGGIPLDLRRNHRIRLLAGDRAGIQILTPPASYQGAGARGKSVHPPWA